MENVSLFSKLVNSSKFVGLMDDGDWEYVRFGFGELDGECYYVELEGWEDDRDVYKVKGSIREIIFKGVNKGYFFKEYGSWYYKEEEVDNILEYINSLKI